jgi:hypothetical protein
MALAADKVMVSVCIEKKYIDRIDKWAGKLGHSRSKLMALIIESGIDSDGWALDALTSRPGLFVIDAIRLLAAQDKAEESGMVPAA